MVAVTVLGVPRRAAAQLSGGVGASSRELSRSPKAVRWRLVLERSLLAAGPAVTIGFFVSACIQHSLAVDFMGPYLHGARDVWAGRSPYHPDELANGVAFVYPPLAAYAVAPFLLLPPLATEIVVSILAAIACFGALWIVGVRDRRCYLLAFGSPVMFFSIQAGNFSALVTLGAAFIWRYRDRRLAALGAGLLIAIKLYTWPLLLFFLFTRRGRSAAVAAASATASVLLPWAALGFAGLTSYPQLLSRLTQFKQDGSYTVGALIARAAPWSVAHAVTYLLAALVVIWMARGRGDARTFSAALGLMILLTPLVLYDYFGVLFVALGVMKRGYGWQWMAPLLLWLSPSIGRASALQLALVLGVVGLVWSRTTCTDDTLSEPEALPELNDTLLSELRARVARRRATEVSPYSSC